MTKQNLRRRIERLRAEKDPAKAGELARLEERRNEARERSDAYRPDLLWLARFGKKGKYGSRRRAQTQLRAEAHRAEMARAKMAEAKRKLREAENAGVPATLLERLKQAVFG